MPRKSAVRSTQKLLEKARGKIYEIAGGSFDSGDVRAAKLTTKQRIAFLQGPEFGAWAAAEQAAGRTLFWLKDVDMTQGSGDVFTLFFKWRADNNKFTRDQLQFMKKLLVDKGFIRPSARGISYPHEVLQLWMQKEKGGTGFSLFDFWRKVYWPTQVGLTREEKIQQVREFAPSYASRVYPGVRMENELLEKLGVNVVIVSYGDQELAVGISEILGIKPGNVVGSNLLYDEAGRSIGVKHSYELFDKEWNERPQAGKPLSFHYWLHMNRHRWGWEHIDDSKFVIVGRDGDSASSDGGMMILLPPPAIGNFMVQTPFAPERLEKFYKLAAKYGWTKGQFFTLIQHPAMLGNLP